jgi:oligoribonuclease NrnB/cAMP/cGMP phosphodiesterase (DHH superfamily)
MSKKTVLLYHAGCPDGFGAAWAFWRKYGDSMEYIPVSHGTEPPNIEGCDVFIADFCYKRPVMIQMKADANSLVVLDHHKSSQEECGDLEFCNFDMNHSGAFLAWDYLFSGDNVPLLIRYVEDRDLWKWNLDSTEEILSAVDSFERTFENWDMLHSFLDAEDSVRWKRVKTMGEGILQYKKNLIKSLMRNAYQTDIMGKLVPIINIPFFQSEIAAELALTADYAAAYYFDGEAYKFSLRSKEGGDDVSLVAAEFGGGGHKNASGFRIESLSQLAVGDDNDKKRENK